MFVSKIQKVGNGLYISLPRPYANKLGLKKRDYVTVAFTGSGLLVRPLEEILKGRRATK